MTAGPKPRTAACSQCSAPITRAAKTGMCRTCANRANQADPVLQAKRRAALAAYFDKPGAREAAGERLRRYCKAIPPERRERLREHGRWLKRTVLTPDVVAKSQTPEARARSVRKGMATKFGWCPADLYPLYRHLVDSKKMTAAEARSVVEEDIPGTAAHARREIANRQIVQRLTHERRQREAY